ncbi:DUF6686 family protein [Rapidithrix thailandica]|uniref:DUF6686 family protein n=1 Tax=Rapidithrix thailandica TaxID=413964 RepID=A0AAW9S819_9BACT
MNTCEPKILVENSHFYIAQCQHCKRIGLSYKNILVGYQPEEFIQFANKFNQINFEERCYVFPDGKPYIIVNTCHQDIQFSFTKRDFETLKQGFSEALLMLEAEKILNL